MIVSQGAPKRRPFSKFCKMFFFGNAGTFYTDGDRPAAINHQLALALNADRLHFQVLAKCWRLAGKDPGATHVKVAFRFCRIAYQIVAGRSCPGTRAENAFSPQGAKPRKSMALSRITNA